MSRTFSRMLHQTFLVLSPFGSSLLFCLLQNESTLMSHGLSLPFQGGSAPLVYGFFGVCLIFWSRVYDIQPNKRMGWGIVIAMTLLFLACAANPSVLPNILPAFLIWIGAMSMTIILD
ncbi:hypothetical protein [Dubosiella newyorkensis]|jgi:hypothetical protein|uniref:Uncharacterized protein n=1 Tax=Dubosiella newyorkensis TaxID=1862672 RepID=A0A1U7NMZ8_9FIRM|nr:hypothetical protein [Dubosiella newyorkensis]MCI9041800.1 hypothetical protein [Dubosiella newyorkensis]OLU46665.1 hypothetical protein BO225_05735 [Dubosiella newyorkensis]